MDPYEACTYAVGVCGNLLAFVLFLSPIPTFRRIVSNKSTESFSALPYIYSLLNCLICLWYGLPIVTPGVILIATVNSVGAIFQSTYIFLFIIHAPSSKKVKVSGMLAGVFLLFLLIIYVSISMFEGHARQIFVGYLSMASLISMFASPLFIINLVIRTRSVEFMPFYLSLSTFLMSTSFFAYGILLHDLFIYIPNGIGVILAMLQLILFAYYRKVERREESLPLLIS